VSCSNKNKWPFFSKLFQKSNHWIGQGSQNLKSCRNCFQINCVHKLNFLLYLQIWFNWRKENLIYLSRFFSWDYGYFEIVFNRMKVIKHLKEIYVSMMQFNVFISIYWNENLKFWFKLYKNTFK
jgi:hypothetical protein